MKTNRVLMAIVLLGFLVLAGCRGGRVGKLRSEAQSVKLDGSQPVRVNVDFGAGNLKLKGGAQQLMEADFTYNVARIRPTVEYARGTLAVSQPTTRGWPDMRGITGFRNEWDLRLYDDVPMDLTVDVGAGTSDLQVAGLSLTRLKVNQGAGTGTIDLDGAWTDDLDVTIDAGAADLTVLLPSSVGVRIVVDRGATLVSAPGLSQDGNVYTNAAYGESEVTLRLKVSGGIGFINLEMAESD
ncbi:MAG: toast rack family protein [Bacteroidota bacterium]